MVRVKDDDFKDLLWQQGNKLHRQMPWREDTRPYYILVSELMLQQTQVNRVIPIFESFISSFPDVVALSQANLSDVLRQWHGLGYNRRAKFLHNAAKKIIELGTFPRTQEALTILPGVGKNTAGAIAAYSFNFPSIFVETNIRTVYIHHFFDHMETVSDTEIEKKLECTLDSEHPREFYWALMDYGTYLKASGVRTNMRGSSYKKQPPLKGSVRETRGMIITALIKHEQTIGQLQQLLQDDERLTIALSGLEKDGLVTRTGAIIHLT